MIDLKEFLSVSISNVLSTVVFLQDFRCDAVIKSRSLSKILLYMLLPFLVFLKRAYVWLVEYFGGLGFSNGIELGKMIFTPSYISL